MHPLFRLSTLYLKVSCTAKLCVWNVIIFPVRTKHFGICHWNFLNDITGSPIVVGTSSNILVITFLGHHQENEQFLLFVSHRKNNNQACSLIEMLHKFTEAEQLDGGRVYSCSYCNSFQSQPIKGMFPLYML